MPQIDVKARDLFAVILEGSVLSGNKTLKSKKNMKFIICERKKSRPKVSPDVCKHCDRKKKCPEYNAYVQPFLFPRLTRTPVVRKGNQGRRIYQESDHSQGKHTQMIFLFNNDPSIPKGSS
jgi:hypothetical protein